jgi:hypothetical protein
MNCLNSSFNTKLNKINTNTNISKQLKFKKNSRILQKLLISLMVQVYQIIKKIYKLKHY